MARREIPVGNADDVMRLASKQRCPGSLYYVGGQFDHSTPWSDAFYADLYAAFREKHISSRDQSILMSSRYESLSRISQLYDLPKSTIQSIIRRTTRAVMSCSDFGKYAVMFEEFGHDLRALLELFD